MLFPEAIPILAPLGPWFETVKRTLPWRAADLDASHPDPYAVLVSEVMLQQTQVATVVPYFQRWMARFPTLAALAAAGEDEVHGLWAGLGYYRRARNLHRAAALLARDGWPRDLDGLLALPGLGPYTAAALAAQAFQWPTPALDGNAFRVAARLLALEGDPRRAAAELRAWLRPALAAHGPSRLTQAIMELGATLCAPAPRCADCPLRTACRARQQGSVQRIPPALPRARPAEMELHLVAVESKAGWLLRPPARTGLLAGLWSWPAVPARLDPAALGAAEAAVQYRAAEGRAWPGWVQAYSHLRQSVHPLGVRLDTVPAAPEGLAWVPDRDLAGLPMGRRDQRLRELLARPAAMLPLDEEAWRAVQAVLAGAADAPVPGRPGRSRSPAGSGAARR
jgi:A/G-specific adenine glycosylase